MAQAVLADRFADARIDAIVDSSGISDEEAGNLIDPRARRVLAQAGYPIPEHRARSIELADFGRWDLILPMTYRHWWHLRRLAERSGRPTAAVRMLREFEPGAQPSPSPSSGLDIEDPWYGGMSNFTHALAQIVAASSGVLAWARQRTPIPD
jgi:protein-tyrosine phosphatase